MSEPVMMVEIRCRGCHRMLGIGPADFRIYCDEMCADDFPAASQESRDALVEAIHQEHSVSKSELARCFGVSRQWIDQILARRRVST